ncbi:hypothetical protein K469DRAFT_732073 [Zopfia rhizophila CBS 207.26]|uniref:Cupin 2 conserved barrel domain-containing protein n=1 Tax=Zopfia rhizophila CBS 207.26 TaxID=1314779 RepID=A0A6A6EMN7_9PEZI|nr:hypothetical protein K469DRAFT_732073 [Zopfia rhizophila CBS 207.26]
MAHIGVLPILKRFIATHDESGKAVFSNAISEENVVKPLPDKTAGFALRYATKDTHGIVISNGTVPIFANIAPNHLSPMHRTVSLDYGIVLEGDVELVLDSWETRRMKRGDVAIQRGMMHAWRNDSSTEWAKLVFVLQHCKPVEVAGQTWVRIIGLCRVYPNRLR